MPAGVVAGQGKSTRSTRCCSASEGLQDGGCGKGVVSEAQFALINTSRLDFTASEIFKILVENWQIAYAITKGIDPGSKVENPHSYNTVVLSQFWLVLAHLGNALPKFLLVVFFEFVVDEFIRVFNAVHHHVS